ncbi:MAG: transcriptional regulator [Xanthomonadaceae bacterium]|nr:transcriptional regulator [Xanthomonadaceae bacterium]MDE1958091.1 transcriptional regulator [Xanthomonadaceae bacterium]MDE2177539.1 transcriptional regulator [Xanthomonadaceae bacterium]MDE2244674.1 transcriptional regulator [Xanthomonadaceae bacterium]
MLIQTVTPAARSPLLALVKRIADSGCNLADTRVSTVGSDVSLILLAQGPWDAVAKLEAALARAGRDEELHLVSYRTTPRAPQSHLLPYVVEVVAADKPGVMLDIIEFFARRSITIEQLTSSRYRAMQTGADMFSAQITVGIPSEAHIAALRDDFLELCDGLNLDAIMDPMKF